MVLFAFEAFDVMAATLRKAASLSVGRFQVARFENGELHVQIQTPVRKEDCSILGSFAPPDEQMISLLLLAHTLKKEGASHVTAILPYLAYARHDKEKPGESLATAWLGAIAKASWIETVVTADVHSERGQKQFPIQVISLSPATVFADALDRFHLKGATIVAPDEGAIHRCEAVRRAAGMAPDTIPYFTKSRTVTGIAHTGPIGSVGHQAVIVDDILDTGGTLLSACERLGKAGVEEIHIMVTHGLFTGDRWKELWRLGVKRIFCTDSIPTAVWGDEKRIEQLSIVPLLENTLCSLAKM